MKGSAVRIRASAQEKGPHPRAFLLRLRRHAGRGGNASGNSARSLGEIVEPSVRHKLRTRPGGAPSSHGESEGVNRTALDSRLRYDVRRIPEADSVVFGANVRGHYPLLTRRHPHGVIRQL